MLEHLTEITAVDPATAGRTSDEMLRFVLRRIANALAEVFSARDICHRGPPVKREGYPSAGVFPVTGFTSWTRAHAGHRIEIQVSRSLVGSSNQTCTFAPFVGHR